MIFNKNRDKAASSVSKTDLLGTSALTTQRSVMRTAWDLIKPYWATGTTRKEKLIAYTLLATALGMTVWSATGISVSIADWSSQWGDTLQNMFALATNHKDWVTDKTLASSTDMQAQLKDFWVNLGNYGILASKNLFAAAAGFVSLQELALRWRGWETDRQVNNWLDDDAYYRTQIAKKMVDNPDQRLAEDIPELTNTTLSLMNDALGNALTLATFSSMLWGMSGDFNLASMGSSMPDLVIPRFMFTAAIAYAAAGTGITYFLGRKLADQQFQQQKLEANFRADLIRTLENSEQVAMGKAAGVQKETVIDDFDLVLKNRKNLIRTQKTLLISNSVYGQAADPFPVLITLPLILAGKVTYGGFRKTAFAFGRVQGSLSWFVDNFQTLARYKATVNRLGNYNDAVQQVKDEHEARKALADEETARRTGKSRPIQVSENDSGDITFKNLTLVRPGTDNVLLKNFSYTLKAGETMVLTGASGCGKSTLFRAAEDFCEDGSGDISLPKDRMGSAQKIFMPKVPVRDMIAYNELGKEFTDAEIEFSLNEAGLERLVQHIPGRHTQNAIDAVLANLPANMDAAALKNDLADRIIAGISGKYETAQSTPDSVKTHLAEQLAQKYAGQDAEMKDVAEAVILRVDRHLVDGLIETMKGGVERTLADTFGKKFLLPSEVKPFSAALMTKFSRKMDETFDPKNLKSREIKVPTAAQRDYMTQSLGVHVTQMLNRYLVCGEMHRAKFERSILNPKIHLSLGTAFTYAASPVKRLTNFTASSTAASSLINKLAVTLRQQVVNGYTLSKELSGGEQQRIAFARAYLQKPKFLMMDEPSSALDPAAGIDLFGKLNKHLPDTARIVIAHNEYVIGTANYHAEMSEQRITVKPVAANGNTPAAPTAKLG